MKGFVPTRFMQQDVPRYPPLNKPTCIWYWCLVSRSGITAHINKLQAITPSQRLTLGIAYANTFLGSSSHCAFPPKSTTWSSCRSVSVEYECLGRPCGNVTVYRAELGDEPEPWPASELTYRVCELSVCISQSLCARRGGCQGKA